MPTNLHRFLGLCFLLCFTSQASAITLTSDQTDYITTQDITETESSGIISSLSGDDSSLNSITNIYTITTGDSGATSSAYGIKLTGDYNQITNDTDGVILTTGSSGRGISISDYSTVTNSGSITTEGTTAYGIYASGDENTITSSGSISTSNSTAYGIYANGDYNSVINSGTIDTQVYGIYSNGNENQVVNSGTISTTSGSTAYGIYVNAGSSLVASASSYTTVENTGTITSATSNGIYSKDDYAQITNIGTISSGDGSSDYGIRSSGDNAVITNSGDITSTKYAIYNSGTDLTINNSGNLYGGVFISSGVLNILGGTISGIVDGDAEGLVIVSADFDQASSFEDLDIFSIDSGATFSANDTIEASAISIDTDSSLTIGSGSSITAAIQGESDGVGILNISATDFDPSDNIGISGNALANLNIGSSASLTINNNIYVSDTLFEGSLNLYDTDGLTIFGNVTGGGSGDINIGSTSQIISGDFTLTSGDSLSVSIDGSSIGSLAVSGSAIINSNSELNIITSSDQDYIADGTEFTIVTADSDSEISSISDDNILVDGTDSNLYGFLEFSTTATNDSLIITANRLAASEVTSNINSQNIYNNLTDIGSDSSGKLLEFQKYLDSSGLSGDELTETLNQLAPQSSKANLAVSSNVANNTIQVFENRLSNIQQNFDKGAWIQAIGKSATQGDIKSDDGYQANSLGLVIGIDHEPSEQNIVGLSLSYVRSSVKSLDSSKKNLISSNQISIYNSRYFDKYFLDSFAGFAWNSYSSTREIEATQSTATSRYFGQTYIAKIKVGRTENLINGFILTPTLSLNLLHNNIAGYSEDGAEELNLTVRGVSANFLEARIGVNLGFSAKPKEIPEFKIISANLKLSYGHSLINDAPTTKANFNEQDLSFDSQISQIDRQSIKAGFSANIHNQVDTIFSLNYDLERKATYQSHLLVVNIKQLF